ncbi:hypothetical protein LS68_006240 [Helicobacter sp. MIT 05-5293]|uniref:hypothetical protein n=1 Tax=Helicobacter sp. MIT 05-5293 TaxID=1548149 RepID=UPI00051D5ABF|nr:hypothetical protein [Helicobacter sp. MIT 05-5293]TLD81060.1 hypothetical protein LS68_006240 [Helicobacter sp. MIT 05-5293]
MNNATDTDKYTHALDEKIIILQECQRDKKVTSCSKCEAFIGCKLRGEYVKAAYESMTKGQQGSFDFN